MASLMEFSSVAPVGGGQLSVESVDKLESFTTTARFLSE